MNNNIDSIDNITKSIDLLLNSDNLLNFQSFIVFTKQQSYGAEFEIRFQNLTKNQFEQLTIYIESDNLYTYKNESKSVSEILPDNVRIEKFGTPNASEYKEVYQNKREIKSMKMLINNIPIKFNLSRENTVQPSYIKNKKILLTRIKSRKTYNFNLYNIDLTYVETFNENVKTVSYEVEIEFKNNKNITDLIVISPVKYILKLLKPDRFSFMNESIEYDIRVEYSRLFSSDRGSIKNVFENKPINFKLENIETFNHSITNKLNGINYFLFYNSRNNYIYLINNSTVEYLGKDTNGKLKGDMLIQGELFYEKDNDKYIFYIFDVLFVNSKRVTNDFHKTRLDNFFPYFNLIDECLFYSGKGISIQYKMFYGIHGKDPNNPNDNYYNDLIQCLHSLSKDRKGNIDMETNDGFIFTPLNKPYINRETYKYKFPETMTIDFVVKYKNTENNKNIYNVYTYNERKDLVEFILDKNKYVMECNLDENKNLCKQIKDDVIVECFFDKNKNVFVPYRIRHDKVLPNFYKVAINVFNDILNPISIKDLENLFKKKFTNLSLDVPQNVQPIEISEKELTYEPLSPPESNQKEININFSPPSLKNYYSPSDYKEPKFTKIKFIKSSEKIPVIKPLSPKSLSPKPLSPKPLSPKKHININNVTLKVKLDTIFECVLFSVSPEYRILTKTDSYKRELMFNTSLEYFNNDKNKISDINLLASSFNIEIYILSENNNKYEVINKTNNENDNKLYVLEFNNYYEVLGYTENSYELFIY